MLREPNIHSHIEDSLDDNHPLAYKEVCCKKCGAVGHAANNECMSTWVETGKGNYCLHCFVELLKEEEWGEVLEDDWGLDKE